MHAGGCWAHRHSSTTAALIASCSGGGSSASTNSAVGIAHPPGGVPQHGPPGAVEKPAGSAGTGGSVTLGQSVPPAGPLIVRTGALTLAVRPSRLTSTFDQISGQAMSLGGFVQSSSQQGTGRNPVASLVLRVPSDRFDALLTDVAGDGRVRSQQVTGQDVTGQSIDLAARIRNLQSEEAALRGLMTRAGSIHSILALQNEFFGVESDAEQLASQRGSLLDRATDGTLSVVLVPLAPTRLPVRHHENVIVRGAALAARNTVTALRAVALALGWAFPLLAVAALAVGSWWWWRRRLRRTTPAGETR